VLCALLGVRRFLASASCRFNFRDRSNVSPRTGFESVIFSTCRKASWLSSRFVTAHRKITHMSEEILSRIVENFIDTKRSVGGLL
jgi:hypothetical protein